MRRQLGLIVLGSLLAASARADVFFDSGDVPVVESGGVYFGFGAAAYRFNAPERTNVGTLYNDDDPIITDNDLLDLDADDVTPLWGLTVGYVLAPGAQALGSNTRVELTGHYFGFSDGLGRRLMRPDYTDFLAIDGTGFVDDPASPGEPVDAKLHVAYDYLDAGVLVRTDFALGGGVVLSPSVGLGLWVLDEHHSLQFIADETTPFNRIREDVETWSGGPTVGSLIRVPLFFGLSLRVGGTAWLAYSHSEYDATQIFFPGDPASGGASADNVRSGFGFRGTGSASLAWEAGPVVLAVTAGVDYWDRAPEIVHPQATIGADYDSIVNTQSAEIDLDDTTSYFGGITLAVRLGR